MFDSTSTTPHISFVALPPLSSTDAINCAPVTAVPTAGPPAAAQAIRDDVSAAMSAVPSSIYSGSPARPAVMRLNTDTTCFTSWAIVGSAE